MTTYMPHLTLPQAVFDSPAASIILPIALGTAVGFGTRPTDAQKARLGLKQAPCHPPPAVFPPVWTTLYGLMGYAAYRAVHYGTSPLSPASTIRIARHGATLYTIQLGLNLAWMPMFFTLRRPAAAVVNLVALLGLNGYLAYLWGSIDQVAGWCMVPYLGWLGFGTYLAAGTGYLNDWDLSDKEVSEDQKKQD